MKKVRRTKADTTGEPTAMSRKSERKAVNLIEEEQIESFENARAAVEAELGASVTDGNVVRELCRAYMTFVRNSEKTVNLVEEEQVKSFDNAKIAVEAEIGEDAADGDVIRELSRAYTGYDPGHTSATDPVFSRTDKSVQV